MKRKALIWGGLTVVLAIATFVILQLAGNQEESQAVSQASSTTQQDQSGNGFVNILDVREDDWTKGNPDADIVVIKYSDFQCPSCLFQAAMDQKVTEELSDEVLFVYRHFPLPSHQYARLAAKYAEAAGNQGKFWEMHDLIFTNQRQWSGGRAASAFQQLAQSLDIDMEQLKNDVTDPEIAKHIDAEYQQGDNLGVTGVPSIFINGQKMPFSGSIDQYRNQILSF
jgi:protein-disulfide isomerase